jgi:hypothetical protein
MPRFVVLEHDSPDGRHWDFMLEAAAALATWALRVPPDSPGSIVADRLADHRLAYLDYEGPVSGERGSVTRWDRGDYVEVLQTDRRRVVLLAGEKLKGTAALTQSPEDANRWQFSFVPE